MKVLGLTINWFKQHLPLLAVVVVALIIAFQNIDPNTFYSGWDNVHPEFDLIRYARQVFFGAWIEHQNLGAPAAQAHLAEIPRLPILFLLEWILPTNLSRYAFIFLMYLIGGVGMYCYLSQVWLKNKLGDLKNWLASLGGIFYLLHILTFQQFYIAFEMFTVQFAFLPFLLLAIHQLAQKINARNILIFIGLQLLIAPSGHTPTVFYLGTIFALLYSGLLMHKKGLVKALRFGLAVGLMTLLTNAYWILPNLYYTFHDSRYVQESRDNQLFAQESVQSVREAGTVSNFLSGTQYLLTWKDYSFETKKFDYIFNEWQDHLAAPPVRGLLMLLGLVTVLGVFLTVFDKSKGAKRWAMVLMYLFCLAFIWIDLLPTSVILDRLYQSGAFREAFRNPFTKLSVIYSFVSIVAFMQVIEVLALRVKNKTAVHVSLMIIMMAIVYIAWPSFQGHFLSEKLKIQYPAQYWEMFDYLKTRDRNLRVLQLPQLSHAGWEYYDWQFLGAGNGYQGMGFYMFAMPQPFAHRDADRWVETSDFFYYELKPILDTQDAAKLTKILEKYNVDLLIIDETKMDPTQEHQYAIDHRLAAEAGFQKVWQKDFLTIYERQSAEAQQGLIVPEKLTFATAETKRVRLDVAYENEGEYVLVNGREASVLYPFSGLVAHQLSKVVLTETGVQIHRAVPTGRYTLSVPGLVGDDYFVPAAVEYRAGQVTITFPQLSLTVGKEIRLLPKLPDLKFAVKENFAELLVFANDVGVIVQENEIAYPVFKLTAGQPFSLEYTAKPEQLEYLDSGSVDGSSLTTQTALKLMPDWKNLLAAITFETGEIETLTLTSQFPVVVLDPSESVSENCAVPQQGSIQTDVTTESIIYRADLFGVNCSGYGFPSMSPAYSYILGMTGASRQGRGLKVFVNYPDQPIVFEDYLMQGKNWQTLITLDQLSADPTASFELNWETRSFGKRSVNQLRSMQITPFPLRQLAQLRLERAGNTGPVSNGLKIISQKMFVDAVHVVEVECSQAKCYLGLDQSYDELWLSVKLDRLGLLPHRRLNTWANLWEVDGSGTVVIFYLPELVSLLSMAGLVVGILILVKKRA